MRKGLIGAAALAVLASLTACGAGAGPTPGSSPEPSTSPTAPPGADRTIDSRIAAPGSDGLTVRQLDSTGAVKTLRVEDFPR